VDNQTKGRIPILTRWREKKREERKGGHDKTTVGPGNKGWEKRGYGNRENSFWELLLGIGGGLFGGGCLSKKRGSALIPKGKRAVRGGKPSNG